ncbi:hypothetical protein [Rhizobium sp. 2MFCol3.1]|uniref:hypothetical protein n=1 Tax=Rhizobium sp. 2MFCol3.1 TaxID=1246459 RepID=UPI00037421E9|nr:hypothetical protein [Rhizobium sp. 2MFCol3.1]
MCHGGERRGPYGSDYHPDDIEAARFVEGRLGDDDEVANPCRFGGNCKRCLASLEQLATFGVSGAPES